MNLKIRLNGPIAKSTFKTSAVFALRLAVQAGTLLLVARMLGPADFGAFAAIVALAVLLGTFSTFGTHLVLLAEVSKDQQQRDVVLPYALPTTLLTGGALFGLFVLISVLWLNNANFPLSVLLCIGLTETLLLPLYMLPATEQLALEKTAQSQLLTTLPLGLRTLAAALVMLLAPEQPLVAFAWLYMTSAVLALALMKWHLPNAWPAIKQWRLAKVPELKHSAGYATLALTAAGPSELDKMLAVKLLPLGVSGLYVAASRVIGTATLPVIALLLSAMPRLFRDSQTNPARSRHLMNWILLSVLLYGLVLAGLFWLTAPWIEWLFGSRYAGISDALVWLCFAVPGLALRFCVSTMLLTIEKPWLRAGLEVLGMLTLVVLAGLVFAGSGVKGMALALAASEWVMVGVGVIFIIKCRSFILDQNDLDKT